MSDKRKSGPMNRAKNKPAFGDLVDTYGMGDARVVSSDERKTVILDSEFEGLEFDDKVWLFWRKNRVTVISALVALFLSAAGMGLWKSFVEKSKNSLANNYALAVTSEERAAFAEANSGRALAGVALLVNADALFEDGKFVEAAASYRSAASELGGTLLHGRALLGEGVSLIKGGKTVDGFAALAAIEGKPEAGVFGAEASFHLAMQDVADGKTDAAKARFEKLAENPSAGSWSTAARANLMRLSSE